MLTRLRQAHHAADDQPGFTAYLHDLRAQHHRKTALLTQLDRARL